MFLGVGEIITGGYSGFGGETMGHDNYLISHLPPKPWTNAPQGSQDNGISSELLPSDTGKPGDYSSFDTVTLQTSQFPVGEAGSIFPICTWNIVRASDTINECDSGDRCGWGVWF